MSEVFVMTAIDKSYDDSTQHYVEDVYATKESEESARKAKNDNPINRHVRFTIQRFQVNE